MKKFGFLIPVMSAITALCGTAEAKLNTTGSYAPSDNSIVALNKVVASNQVGVTEAFFERDGERHSLMMKLSESGQVLAYHSSHASHASHASHSSHASHRSGY